MGAPKAPMSSLTFNEGPSYIPSPEPGATGRSIGQIRGFLGSADEASTISEQIYHNPKQCRKTQIRSESESS